MKNKKQTWIVLAIFIPLMINGAIRAYDGQHWFRFYFILVSEVAFLILLGLLIWKNSKTVL